MLIRVEFIKVIRSIIVDFVFVWVYLGIFFPGSGLFKPTVQYYESVLIPLN